MLRWVKPWRGSDIGTKICGSTGFAGRLAEAFKRLSSRLLWPRLYRLCRQRIVKSAKLLLLIIYKDCHLVDLRMAFRQRLSEAGLLCKEYNLFIMRCYVHFSKTTILTTIIFTSWLLAACNISEQLTISATIVSAP